jgi:hypothetical protein
MKIEVKGMKLTIETCEKIDLFSDGLILSLDFVAFNKTGQLSYKKTVTPKIIGVAVSESESNSFLSSYNLSIQSSKNWQTCRTDDAYFLQSFTGLLPYLSDCPLLSDSTMCHHTYMCRIRQNQHIELCLKQPYLPDWLSLSDSTMCHHTYMCRIRQNQHIELRLKQPYLPDWLLLSDSTMCHHTYMCRIRQNQHIALCLKPPYLPDWLLLFESTMCHHISRGHYR